MSRRRLAIALAAVAAIALLVVGLLRLTGDDGPAEEAAALIPAEALAYVHVGTDPDREADRRLLESLGGFPGLGALQQRLGRAIGRDFDAARDVRPWLGTEVAFALLEGEETRADSLLVLAVRDRAKADAFLDRASGSTGTGTYQGVEVRRYGAVAAAFVDGFLVVGQETAVRDAVDVAQAREKAITTTAAYRRVAEDRPGERALDVVLTADGVRRVLRAAPGVLGVAGAVLDHPELVAVGASLAAEEEGLRLTVRQSRSGGGVRDFEPTLAEEVPKDAAAYIGLNGLEALGALVPAELARTLRRPLDRALRGASLDLDRDVLEPLRGEVAISVTPGLPAPTVTLVARTDDEKRTREALARLQPAIAELLAPPGGAAGTFEQRALGRAQAYVLAVTPGLEIAYTVHRGRLIFSTRSNGVGHVVADRSSVTEAEAFGRAVGDLPDRAQAILFLDLGQLLTLAEQAGSTGDPGFDAVADDLRRVRTAGAVVTREENDSTAELFFEIP